MSEVNILLLRKAVEWAEAEAAKPWELREWDQEFVIRNPESAKGYQDEAGKWVDASKAAGCGTNYCIAGFIAETTLAPGEKLGMQWDILAADGTSIEPAIERAAARLGIDADESMDENGLFAGGNSIQDVRRIAESIAGESL
ncbi:MAG: hypothetical protein ABWY12_11220 [Burkholderiales bacterium]